jgi:biotin operon repressor
MAKKKTAEPIEVSSVTADRAARLYRLVRLLTDAPQSRAALLRRLNLNIRGFYRDLEALRTAGVTILLVKGRYTLDHDPHEAIELLPFPDPGLTMGEARQLAKGRTRGHKKIQVHLKNIEQ